MSRRETVEPTINERGDETHPAFGTVTVVRAQGTSRSLFQSDLLHNQTVILEIQRATRNRDLNRDWVHPTEGLISIEMSQTQWASLVGSVGTGGGTPVTLRRTENEIFVPEIPYQPRMAKTRAEVEGVVNRLLGDIEKRLDDLSAVVENKGGVRATKEALRALTSTVQGAARNASFAVESLETSAESVVAQAKSDIESAILRSAEHHGIATVLDSDSVLGITATPEGDPRG